MSHKSKSFAVMMIAAIGLCSAGLHPTYAGDRPGDVTSPAVQQPTAQAAVQAEQDGSTSKANVGDNDHSARAADGTISPTATNCWGSKNPNDEVRRLNGEGYRILVGPLGLHF